jgi:hypothetical protein
MMLHRGMGDLNIEAEDIPISKLFDTATGLSALSLFPSSEE